MATVSFPSIKPQQSSMALVSNTKTFRSPLTGAIQTAARSGTRWRVNLTFENLKGADRYELQGFLAKLDGQRNFFEVQDHTYTLQGNGGGTPLVKGANQTGNSLTTDGWPNSTLVLKRGDQLHFDNGSFKELKMVTDNVTSDGLGNATINISPEIHTSPADNVSIEVNTPLGTFILLNQENGWSSVPGIFATLIIQAVEVIV